MTYNGSLGGGKVVNLGFPFETITNPNLRTAYMSDVLRFFALVGPPDILNLQLTPDNLTIQWSASAGLRYQVQSRTDMLQPTWSILGDVTATNTVASFTDSIASGQRFYRVVLLH